MTLKEHLERMSPMISGVDPQTGLELKVALCWGVQAVLSECVAAKTGEELVAAFAAFKAENRAMLESLREENGRGW